MSILDYLVEYSKDYKPPSIAWRERRVWHKTKTGEMNFVKIKSLTPDEQMKYKPMDLVKKAKKAKKLDSAKIRKQTGGIPTQTQQPEIEPEKVVEGETFDFYFGVKDPEKYNEIKEGELVIATLDSSRAVDFEDDDGLRVVFVANVPIDTVKEYLDEEGDWKKIEITDRDEKAEFIKFDETDFFKLDLFPFKDKLQLELQDDLDDDEDEDVKKESLKDYEKYIIESYLKFRFENRTNNFLIETIEPTILQKARELTNKLSDIVYPFKDFDFQDNQDVEKMASQYDETDPEKANEIRNKYTNLAYFTDKLTKSTITLQVRDEDSIDDLIKALLHKIELTRNEYNKQKSEPVV